MEFRAKVSSVRITPRKVGLLADQVRGKAIQQAMDDLQFSPRKRVAQVLRTLLRSAVANAEQGGTVDIGNLFVKQILVGQGTTLKRVNTRAKGAAHRIHKKTSHVYVTLAERR